MKKVMVILIVVAVIAVAYYSGFLKSDEAKIEDRMNAFLSAYNSGDMDGVLESLDAKTRNTYKSVLSVGDTLISMTGVSIKNTDLFALGVGLTEGQTLRFIDMEIDVVSETKATVSATMLYHDLQESYSKNVKFTLVKENGDWYICG